MKHYRIHISILRFETIYLYKSTFGFVEMNHSLN